MSFILSMLELPLNEYNVTTLPLSIRLVAFLQAVQCIGASTLLSTVSLLPIKGKVVKSLSKVLDDPKRDVRSEAAKARSEWYLVGV